MYLKKIPDWVRRLFPDFLWKTDEAGEVLYLTFDDGPTPGITPWVLDQLDQYDAKATFFLVGRHVTAHPEIVHDILDQGHSIGNHTHSHLNGWKTEHKSYLRDFLRARQAIAEYTGHRTRLFRPPYGRITRAAAEVISRTHRIVMMDVIAGDFDARLKPETVLNHVLLNAGPGSIVLLHDSEKAFPRLREALPRILDHYAGLGYRFAALPMRVRETAPALVY
ncbi:MAG: polysaccharide deacetylase family protein [Bacteroidia bacterium]|nr:polysaccharide deacetylase family protein [Bacteroidia bacterium]